MNSWFMICGVGFMIGTGVISCDAAQVPAGKQTARVASASRLHEFVQQISAPHQLTKVRADRFFALPVTIKNTGRETWPATGAVAGLNLVHLTYHWLDHEGITVLKSAPRTALPAPLAPGRAVALTANIQAPAKAGNYFLLLTMVQENVAYFDSRGAATSEVEVSVDP